MHRTTCFLLVILFAIAGTAAIAGRGPQPASAQHPTAQTASKPPLKPLESVLNHDGTLNLQSGYTGSLDPQGWRMVSSQGEKPRFVRDAPDAPNVADDANWDRRFAAPGLSDYPYAIAVSGNDVYVGGNFDSVEGIRANNIARWDSATGRWHTLGNGPNNGVNNPSYATVFAIEVMGDDVYVGGGFLSAGGVPTRNIARWNTAAEQWHPLGDGLNGDVLALAISGTDVYVGGRFSSAGGAPANNIARWDSISQQWSPLGSGIGDQSSRVKALAIIGNDLYVGGWFTFAGPVSTNNIARWNTVEQQWRPLTSGTDNYVHALAAIGSDLYVGGSFDTAGDVNVRHIAKWDSLAGEWRPLVPGGAEDTVRALASIGSALYVGGNFAGAGNISATYIARFDTSDNSWSQLSDGTAEGVGIYNDSGVNAIAASSDGVYVGGDFDRAGGVGASYIAKWNQTESQWDALSNSPNSNGLGWGIATIAVSGSDVYVGGYFKSVGMIVVNGIARWNNLTNRWYSLGGGVTSRYPEVHSIVISGSDVYAGGYFDSIGGVPAANIARWNTDTQQWSPLGNGTNNAVEAIAVIGDNVYAGGHFSSPGNRVARWNITTGQWFIMGSGLGAYMSAAQAIAANDTDVYIGGFFSSAGSEPANNIARWNIASQQWRPLAAGIGGGGFSQVTAITIVGADVYVGGDFTTAGGAPASRIAKWDSITEQWNPLGNGLAGGNSSQNPVYAIALRGDDLYVGGIFTVAGGVSANNLAKWSISGRQWKPLGTGINGVVKALKFSGNSMYAGGWFSRAGGRPSGRLAQLHLPCPMPFTDIQASDYFHTAVSYLYCSGAVSGYEDNTFRPYSNTTRAQLTKIVTLAEGWPLENPAQPHFSDVPRNHPFFSYVETAYAHGVIAGYADGSFRARYDVTRAQLAKIITLSEGWELVTPSTPTFSDVPTSNPFYSYIETAYAQGVITGYADNTFRPVNSATRGQISKIVYQAVTQP